MTDIIYSTTTADGHVYNYTSDGSVIFTDTTTTGGYNVYGNGGYNVYGTAAIPPSNFVPSNIVSPVHPNTFVELLTNNLKSGDKFNIKLKDGEIIEDTFSSLDFEGGDYVVLRCGDNRYMVKIDEVSRINIIKTPVGKMEELVNNIDKESVK